jgi:hypothetical protein
MHFDFHFTAVQILWTLTFAALLVLLVVLMGRDRMHRYPWFSAGIALMALRLLTTRLLYNRMQQTLALNAFFIVLADLVVLVAILVVVELARRAFGAASRRTWIAGTLALVAVGCAVLAFWGAWPSWKTLTADSQLATLRLMQLGSEKGQLMVNVLVVELGLLVALFGRRFKAGWRSQTQQILVGLSTVAISQLTLQFVLQRIAATFHPSSQAEYDRVVGLAGRLVNANGVVYLAALIWWIMCLWIDEPGAPGETIEMGRTGVVDTAELPAADAAPAVDHPADAETPADQAPEARESEPPNDPETGDGGAAFAMML